MKKSLKVMMMSAAAVAVLAAGFTGCKTTEVAGSGIKGKSASVKNVKRQIVDYQGATLGSEIPQWVKLVSEGQYGQKVLSKAMPDLEGKKVFVVTGRGDNLDFVKSWVNLVDVETEVSGSLERVTGKVVTSKLEGNAAAKGQQANQTEVDRAINDYRIALQDAINRFMDTLTPDAREIFMLRYWHFLEIREIAQARGMSTGAVKMSLSRTRAALKEFLTKEEIEF